MKPRYNDTKGYSYCTFMHLQRNYTVNFVGYNDILVMPTIFLTIVSYSVEVSLSYNLAQLISQK